MLRNLLTITSFIIIGALSLNNSGGTPGGRTGSPGDGDQTCSGCHGGTPSDEDWISTNIPSSGYVPGTTYQVTLVGVHASVGKFGFEINAEDDNDNKVGTFAVIDATNTKTAGSSITHNGGGISPSNDSLDVTVDWTAPSSGVGNVTFYAAVNATNDDGQTSGDIVYKASHAVSQDPGSPTGLYELAERRSLVYPNPAHNEVFVGQGVVSVKLFSLSGQLMLESNESVIQIDALPVGTYIAVIESAQEIKTEKLILF